MTTKNPILEELHGVRERLLADAGGTLDALVDRLQASEQKSDRPRYDQRKQVRSPGAANNVELPAESSPTPPQR